MKRMTVAALTVMAALCGSGICRALSLRSSAAELFLGDVAPGATLVFLKAAGAKLRVENSGRDPVRVDFKIVAPSPAGVKDGFDPWPFPDKIRVTNSRAELKPDESARAELAVTVPKDAALIGRQFEFDVVATGTDRAGASLTVTSRVYLAVGDPLPSADPPAAGFAERTGFSLSPPSSIGREASIKLVNASDEDLAVSLAPAREWDDDVVGISDGYAPAPNPRWLRFEPGVVKIRAGAIGRARIWADVPKEARYAGRRWAFVAAVDAVAGGRTTRRYFVLHVDAERLEESNRAP
jgi:hypothetical protein